jgi:ferritin
VQEALNKQVNAELYSAYLYLSMSACLEAQNWKGMATWLKVQANEELGHAMKIYEFINQRAGRATLAQIDAPRTEWASPLEAFEQAYEHECKVTGLIGKLVELAAKEKDHATGVFLQWFVTEQVEEEANALDNVQKLRLIGDHKGSLFMLDKTLGKRGEQD